MPREMSILHILNEIRPSGAEVMLKVAAPHWRASDLELHVLSTGRDVGVYAGQLAGQGFTVHHIPFGHSPRFYSRLLSLLRTHRFDVVHIHTERGSVTYACVARLVGVPRLIRTIHSTFLFQGATRIRAILRRWAVRQLGVIQVSISDSVGQNEDSRFQNPSHVICNWYDEMHFREPSCDERAEARRGLGLSEGDRTILTVGNCAPVKNHAALIEALAFMKNRGVSPIYWHVGQEDVEGRERRRAQELGLEKQIHFWGHQPDVRPFLWAADIFVMASFREGLSIAMLEAIACGPRLVLARSPGLVQWSTLLPGIIYAEPSPNALASSLIQALAVPGRAQSAPRGWLQATFGVKQGAQAYLDLYRGRCRIS